MQPTYNKIGIGYNSTRQADEYLLSHMFALLEGEKGKQYLDIGCGTGNYTVALEKKGLSFTGVDPSEVMLKEAKQKSKTINWLQGTAEQIPAEDNSFNGALGILTLHHWQNIGEGFKELFRVLKPKRKLVFFTSLPEQTLGYWLSHYFPALIKRSGQNLPALTVLQNYGVEAGFKFRLQENYFVKEDLKDLFLHSGKHDPELYFREEIRKGISTFAALSNKEEVDKGLQNLRNDIDSGKFASVKKQYDNTIGDYCFVVFEKS
jgi:ubiquinone/menaquinone biosynthesis C-methylase UbiE